MDKNTYNEIDLQLLVSSAKRKFKKFQKWFYISWLSCIFLAITFFFLYPKQYELTLLGSTKVLKPEALSEVANSLNVAAKDRNYQMLASTLKISENAASVIKKIKLIPVRPDVLAAESVNKEGYFQLILTVTAISKLDSLQLSFFRFFESNPSVEERKKLSRSLNERLIVKISKEIENLEKLRDDLLLGKNKDPKFIMMSPAEINETIIELSYRLRELDYDIAMKNEFIVIQGFLPPSKPSFPRLGLTLLAGLLLGFFVAVGVVILSDEK